MRSGQFFAIEERKKLDILQVHPSLPLAAETTLVLAIVIYTSHSFSCPQNVAFNSEPRCSPIQYTSFFLLPRRGWQCIVRGKMVELICNCPPDRSNPNMVCNVFIRSFPDSSVLSLVICVCARPRAGWRQVAQPLDLHRDVNDHNSYRGWYVDVAL